MVRPIEEHGKCKYCGHVISRRQGESGYWYHVWDHNFSCGPSQVATPDEKGVTGRVYSMPRDPNGKIKTTGNNPFIRKKTDDES